MLPFFGNIKIILVGMFSALLPILYAIGRKDGKNLQQKKELESDLLSEKRKSEFYRAMEESSDEPVATPDRDDFIKRLRHKGL